MLAIVFNLGVCLRVILTEPSDSVDSVNVATLVAVR